ncbi:MAG: hypothetical protein ISS89_03195 [Candidatus Omnitrophica bacterium]|nr:hypothetical protein [Candidatus Omnitrophota bacterium]
MRKRFLEKIPPTKPTFPLYFLVMAVISGQNFWCGQKFCPAQVLFFQALHIRGAASLTQKNIGIITKIPFAARRADEHLYKNFIFLLIKNFSLRGRLRLGCPHPAKPQAAPN